VPAISPHAKRSSAPPDRTLLPPPSSALPRHPRRPGGPATPHAVDVPSLASTAARRRRRLVRRRQGRRSDDCRVWVVTAAAAAAGGECRGGERAAGELGGARHRWWRHQLQWRRGGTQKTMPPAPPCFREGPNTTATTPATAAGLGNGGAGLGGGRG